MSFYEILKTPPVEYFESEFLYVGRNLVNFYRYFFSNHPIAINLQVPSDSQRRIQITYGSINISIRLMYHVNIKMITFDPKRGLVLRIQTC